MAMANNDVDRNSKGQFLVGHSRIGGRQLGSRNKLATAFSDDLYKKWKRYGPGCLDTLGKAAIGGDINAAKAMINAVGNHLPKQAIAEIYQVSMAANPEAMFQAAYDMALELINGRPPQAPKLIEHQDITELEEVD
jgi:hypothetical protein